MKSMKEHSENEAALTEKELEAVAGGGSRRTDDPDQANAHRCFNFARYYVESQSTTLPENVKSSLISEIEYLWDRTLSWHLAEPVELIPKVNAVIEVLALYRQQESVLNDAWNKMKDSLTYLEELKRKDEE